MRKIQTSTTYTSENEKKNRKKLIDLFNQWPGSDEFKIRNLGLFQNRINLMRVLFMNELYQKTLGITGDIMEFGCRWGQNLS